MDKTINAEEENLDSVNEETAEETEVEEELEDLSLEDDETENQEEDDEARKRRERKESTIDRLKKERDDWKAKAEAQSSTLSTEEATIARLENRGVMEPEEQAYVLKFAKAEGISPIEALNDEVVKDKIAFMKKQREQRSSSQTPGNRTGSGVKSVDYYITRNEMPKDPAMAAKVREELARRAKDNA